MGISIEPIDPNSGENLNESRNYSNENSVFIENIDINTGETMLSYDDEDEDDFMGLDEEAALEEASKELILDAISKLDDTTFREFLSSEEFNILVEAGKFTKNTIISLSKEDELKKRISAIAINIERQKNSSLYQRYEKARKTMLTLKEEIINKNMSKATKAASKQLKQFAKAVNVDRIPLTARTLDNKKKSKL